MVSFKKLRQMIEIQGNGNIVSREISVSTFIRLHLACKGEIELHQSDEEKVIIETDENLQDFFSAVNAGRTLWVSTDGALRKPVFTKAVVKIYIKQMDKLIIRNDHGNVSCPAQLVFTQPLEVKIQSVGNTDLNLSTPAIKMVCQCEGNVTMRGSCEKIDIKTQMEGNFNSSQLKAGELSIKNMAEGSVDLYAENFITMKHYGEGYIHYYGPAVVKDVVQYGDGEIKHLKGVPA
jgi:hypothetical protein